MKNFSNAAEKKAYIKKTARQVIIACLLVGMLLGVSLYAVQIYREQSISMLKQSVKRAAVECYSIEGIYPPNVEYLEENNYLSYDSDKYYIYYETFAENIMPVIEVYEKR